MNEIGLIIFIITSGFLLGAIGIFIGKRDIVKRNRARQNTLNKEMIHIERKIENLTIALKEVNISKIFIEIQKLIDENLRTQESIELLHARLNDCIKDDNEKQKVNTCQE